MKKLLLLFTLLLFLSACSSDEPVVQPETDDSVENDILPGYRTRQEIIDIAQEYADILYPASAKSRSARRVVDESRVFALSDLKSRSTEDSDIAPLICIVEYSDDNGFAIIATPKGVEPVIAIVDHGSYSDSIANSIPAFQYFMEMATDYVATQKEIVGPVFWPDDTTGMLPFTEQKTVTDTTNYCFVDSLVVTNRGQLYPEGLLCSNGFSGCFPTAALMICEYFKEPSSITLTYESNNTIQLDWASISRVKSQNEGNIITPQNRPIAQFIRQVGYLARASYKSDGTHVSRDYERKTLLQLLPTRSIRFLQEYSYDVICKTISARGLVMCSGTSKEGKGHVWLADGVNYLETTTRQYHRVLGETEWKLMSTGYYTRKLVHFNWGANGQYNCYGTDNVIKNAVRTYESDKVVIVPIY